MTKRKYLRGVVAAVVIAAGTTPTGFAQGWTKIQPAATPPAGRMNNAAVYDPGSGSMIIFGGFTVDSSLIDTNDVWVLSGVGSGQGAWTQLLPDSNSGPPRLAGASAVYDPASNKMIVFGGQANGTSQSQVWILDNANGLGAVPPAWHGLSVSGPSPRQNHQAVYDERSNRMIVFGGLSNTGNGTLQLLNDVWVLTNANGTGILAPQWIQITPKDTYVPSPRQGFAAAFDSQHKRLLIFGGCTDPNWSCGTTSNELWVLTSPDSPNNAHWTKVAYNGTAPTAHWQFSSLAYVQSTNTLFLFGGRIPPPQPGAEATYFGTFTQGTWQLSHANGISGQANWTQLSPAGNPPSPRGQSVTPNLYDPQTGRMIVFGGPGVNDTFTLQLKP